MCHYLRCAEKKYADSFSVKTVCRCKCQKTFTSFSHWNNMYVVLPSRLTIRLRSREGDCSIKMELLWNPMGLRTEHKTSFLVISHMLRVAEEGWMGYSVERMPSLYCCSSISPNALFSAPLYRPFREKDEQISVTYVTDHKGKENKDGGVCVLVV